MRGGSPCGTYTFSVTNNNPRTLRAARRDRNNTGNRNNNAELRVASAAKAKVGGFTDPPGDRIQNIAAGVPEALIDEPE